MRVIFILAVATLTLFVGFSNATPFSLEVTPDGSSFPVPALSCTTSVQCVNGICNNHKCLCDEGYTTDDLFLQCNKRSSNTIGTRASDIPIYGLRNSGDGQVLSETFYCNNSKTSCNNEGVCNDDRDACVCNHGFATYDSTDTQCNYKQKEKLAPLILACFPGISQFGIQWFLVGNTTMGLLQLFLGGWVGIICIAILMCCFGGGCAAFGKNKGEGAAGACVAAGTCFMVLIILSAVGFWIYAIWFFANNPTDGNGVPLVS